MLYLMSLKITKIFLLEITVENVAASKRNRYSQHLGLSFITCYFFPCLIYLEADLIDVSTLISPVFQSFMGSLMGIFSVENAPFIPWLSRPAHGNSHDILQ